MSFFGDISYGTVKGTLEGVGTLAKDLRSAITGEVGPEKKAQIELRLNEFEAMGRNAQAEINKAEARHPSIFVAGWRPALGWTCVFGIGYQMLFRPLMECALLHWDVTLPTLDISTLVGLISGMLGVAGLRTYEKMKGVAR